MASKRDIKKLTRYCMCNLTAVECEDTVKLLHMLQLMTPELIGKLSTILQIIFETESRKKNSESGLYSFIKGAFHDLMVELAAEIYI